MQLKKITPFLKWSDIEMSSNCYSTQLSEDIENLAMVSEAIVFVNYQTLMTYNRHENRTYGNSLS